MAFRITSHEPSQLRGSSFRCFIKSTSWACTSLAFLIPFEWMKCRLHHPASNLYCFALWYTFKRVKWSDSGTKNFSRAASLSSSRSFGLKKTLGTESFQMFVILCVSLDSSRNTLSRNMPTINPYHAHNNKNLWRAPSMVVSIQKHFA